MIPKNTPHMPIEYSAVDGRNPANQLRLVVYPISYRVLYIPGGARFLPSTVCHHFSASFAQLMIFFSHHLVARLKAPGWNGQKIPQSERCLEHSSQKSASRPCGSWWNLKVPDKIFHPWKKSGKESHTPLKNWWLEDYRFLWGVLAYFEGRSHTISENQKTSPHHTWSKRLLQHLLQQMQRQLPVKAPQDQSEKNLHQVTRKEPRRQRK